MFKAYPYDLLEAVVQEVISEDVLEQKCKIILKEKIENGDLEKILRAKIDNYIESTVESYLEDNLLYEITQKPLEKMMKTVIQEGFAALKTK